MAGPRYILNVLSGIKLQFQPTNNAELVVLIISFCNFIQQRFGVDDF